MEDKLISIIVPIYKVEKYLKKCIESIMAQTHKSIEIILVDDGSPDKCGDICEEYAKKDSRIKVIHKVNGGLSDARNAGLAIAKGEYIGFVDSDDYVANDMFETLYNLSETYNADISIVSFYELIEDRVIGVMDSGELEILDKTEGMKQLLEDNKIQSYAWNKLFKRKLFENMKFPTGKNFEDIATTFLLFEKSDIIVRKETPKYYYIRREDSIVGQRTPKTYMDYMDVLLDKYLYIYKNNKELREYNEYNYVISMVWLYTILVRYDINELFPKYNELFLTVEEIMNKDGEFIWSKLDYYNKALLYMMLLDKETSREAIKQFYISYKAKREAGEFKLQI